MARIENGALIGKLGNIVGSSYKGRHYIKRSPVRTAPPTENELKTHYIFKLVIRWLKPLLPFVRLGFKGFSPSREGYNAAKAMLFKEGLYRDGYDSYIDPSIVLLSYGTLGLSENLQATLQGKLIEFTWDPTVSGNRGPRDRIMLAAYNIEEEIAAYELSGPKRMAGSAELSLENYPPGTYHLYVAFVAEDGSRQSNSRYLGEVEI